MNLLVFAQANWEVCLYVDERMRCPVLRFLASQEADHQNHVARLQYYLEQHLPKQGTKGLTRKQTRDLKNGAYELCTPKFRAFYFYAPGDPKRIVATDCAYKKGQKGDQNKIKFAGNAVWLYRGARKRGQLVIVKLEDLQ